MNTPSRSFAALLVLTLLAGCASVPSGPSVRALPGSSKTFDQFRGDDAYCRQYGQSVAGASANQANDAGVRSAAVGTLIGALAGAAIGGHEGAGVGAGTGLLIGSMNGVGVAQRSSYGAQHDFDNAYVQCMYAKGHQVPVNGVLRSRTQAPVDQTPPGAFYPPPPPPGYVPPPPPPGSSTR
jgi:hypothetical protein